MTKQNTICHCGHTWLFHNKTSNYYNKTNGSNCIFNDKYGYCPCESFHKAKEAMKNSCGKCNDITREIEDLKRILNNHKKDPYFQSIHDSSAITHKKHNE